MLLIGLMSLFEATLTMPGIAGLVLTVGMAVDANVIVFERIREELHTGKASCSRPEKMTGTPGLIIPAFSPAMAAMVLPRYCS